MMDFISNEEDKSIENSSNVSKYTDLKANCIWGNYPETNLKNCEGKYCIIDSNGSGMLSNWEENTTKTNRVSGYTLLTTGSTEEVKKKNLYDVAGNLWECVQETANGTNSSYRGGCFCDSYVSRPVCHRHNSPFNSEHTSYGFRPMLYIK